MARSGAGQGWALVGWTAVLLAAMFAIVALTAGYDEDGVRQLVRGTARSSAVLFCLTFAASGLRRLWRHPASAWILRNRRYLGVSFALSHGVHMVAFVWLAVGWTESFTATTAASTIIGGAFGYLWIAAMTVTSFDRPTAWLGRRRWRVLHLWGSYILWGIFVFSYLPAAVVGAPVGIVMTLVVALATAARWVGKRRGRRLGTG